MKVKPTNQRKRIVHTDAIDVQSIDHTFSPSSPSSYHITQELGQDYLLDIDHFGSDLLFGVLLGAGGVTGFGVDESDEAESLPLFGLFVGREDDFLDGAELLEMRLHVFLGGVQGHAAHEDLTDLLLLRDLFRVNLLAFDWMEEGEERKRKERK